MDPQPPRALAEALAGDKELKVRIPLSFHVKLHTIKVLHGQAISLTVREALEAYFRAHPADGPAAAGPAPPRQPADGLPPPGGPPAP